MKKLFTFLTYVFVQLFFIQGVSFAQAEFDNGALNLLVNDYGRIRIYATGGDPKHVERISPLVGGAQNQVFDYQNDMDNETPVVLAESPALSDFEISGAFNNAYTNLPPNVLVDMNLYAWQDEPYIILKYTITNRADADLTAFPGFEVIPEIDGGYGGDVTNYFSAVQATITNREGATNRLGVKILSAELSTLAIESYVDEYWVDDVNLYNWLTSGTIDETGTADADGALIIFGSPSVVLAPGAVTTLYLAAAIADNDDAVLSLLNDAQLKYNTLFTSVETVEVPLKYDLSQNYPNPFNPSTTINFSIPNTEFVTLKIYNMLGQEVARPLNKGMSAGNHTVDFNADNLSSGIYFYELTAGGYKICKKMTLMK